MTFLSQYEDGDDYDNDDDVMMTICEDEDAYIDADGNHIIIMTVVVAAADDYCYDEGGYDCE